MHKHRRRIEDFGKPNSVCTFLVKETPYRVKKRKEQNLQ
jgi:hypothetical protein